MSMFSKRLRSIQISVIAAAAIVSCSAMSPVAAKAQEPKFEMGTFYLCLLVKPADWSAGKQSEAQKLLSAHVKHVQDLLANGKASIAGPFLDNNPIAGLIVLNASSAEEARSWEEADPFVKSGGFSVEVLKWWAAKGIMKPQPLGKMATYYFAFLKRGPKWTGEKTPETAKIQADHMANINAMAKTGKLVIAGPFENAGNYAGIFVFKVASLDEAKALAESDPAVKVGRLTAEVHVWMVAEGSLP